MALGTCCWWSFAGRINLPASSTESGRQVVDLFKDAAPAQIWGMFAVCMSFAGGMGLIALGVGLQHDLSRTGRAAKWITGLIAAFFWAYLGFAVFSFPGAGRIVAAGVMAVGWSALYLLAGASAEQLRKSPPIRRDSSWTRRDEDDLRKTSSPRPPNEMNPSGR